MDCSGWRRGHARPAGNCGLHHTTARRPCHKTRAIRGAVGLGFAGPIDNDRLVVAIVLLDGVDAFDAGKAHRILDGFTKALGIRGGVCDHFGG